MLPAETVPNIPVFGPATNAEAVGLIDLLLQNLRQVAAFKAAGFRAGKCRIGRGLNIYQNGILRGQWRQAGNKLIWSPAEADEPVFIQMTVAEAARRTMLYAAQSLVLERQAVMALRSKGDAGDKVSPSTDISPISAGMIQAPQIHATYR